jgi:hypothetical protein
LEETDGLPKLAMIVACLLAAQPFLVVGLREVGEAFLGEMEPGWLIGGEDESLEDCKDALKSFAGRYYDHAFSKHPAGRIVTEGEVGLRVVGDVEIGRSLEKRTTVVLS